MHITAHFPTSPLLTSHCPPPLPTTTAHCALRTAHDLVLTTCKTLTTYYLLCPRCATYYIQLITIYYYLLLSHCTSLLHECNAELYIAQPQLLLTKLYIRVSTPLLPRHTGCRVGLLPRCTYASLLHYFSATHDTRLQKHTDIAGLSDFGRGPMQTTL